MRALQSRHPGFTFISRLCRYAEHHSAVGATRAVYSLLSGRCHLSLQEANTKGITKIEQPVDRPIQAVTNLLLVSRHKLTTDGLRVLFQAVPWLNVVGQIPDTPDALETVRSINACVIVLDLIAQALKGVSVIREIKTYAPRSEIVALSMCTEDSYVSQALQNGASAYVLKSEGFADLLHAVREVVAGRKHLSSALDADAIRQLVASGDPVDRFESLTARERQVLHLAAQGLTNAQIAARLGISRRTAETHRANVQKKFEFASHADLVSFALRRGLLTRDL